MIPVKISLSSTLLFACLSACGGEITAPPDSNTTTNTTTANTTIGSGGAGGATTTTFSNSTSSSTSTTNNTGGAPTCAPIGPPTTAVRVGIYNDMPESVAIDGTGKLAFTGNFSGSTSLYNGEVHTVGAVDAFVAVLDENGAFAWSRTFGSKLNVTLGERIVFDASGNVLVAGDNGRPIDFGGGLRCVGNVDNQLFLAKLSPQGEHVYSVCFGAPSGHLRGTPRLAVDAAGNALLAAEIHGTMDFGGVMISAPLTGAIVLAKIDPTGNLLWVRQFGGVSAAIELGALTTIGGSDVILAGSVHGAIDFGKGSMASDPGGQSNVFLARIDGNGNAAWSKLFTSTSDDRAHSVAVGPSGNIVLAGEIGGIVSFGGAPLGAQDFADIYLASFDGAGDPLWSRGLGTDDQDTVNGLVWSTDDTLTLFARPRGDGDFGCGKVSIDSSNGVWRFDLDAFGNLKGQRFLPFVSAHGFAGSGTRVAMLATVGALTTPLDLGNGPIPGEGDMLLATWDP